MPQREGGGLVAGRRRKKRVLAGALVLWLSALAGIAGASEGRAGLEPSLVRVRAADTKAAFLLAAGLSRSATFRSLVKAIEESDLVVYVETRPLKIPGRMQLLAATSVCRHIRVSIQTPGLDDDLVAWLGHELTHAVEVAGAPDVRDQAGLRRLYQRIGRADRYGDEVESAAAQETWKRVLNEMRATR